MNPNRTNGLWCKKCLWHKCRCGINRVYMPSLTQYTRAMMDGITHGKGVVKVSYGDDGVVTAERVDPEAMLVDPPPEPQYTRTMTMDDLRRNALESVIEELKERDA